MSYSIELLANNSLYRSKLGMNAKRLAKTVFNRDILAQKYINSLEFIPS
ncbi:MAG: glycosyltransferase family 4 protein [Bacteroidetes bacterium]|nr:glycosyltransferase family 4 protein [Bacteroidota bacterium]